MCGVFSSRIYVADICRDSVFAYFGKRGVTTTAYQTNVAFVDPESKEIQFTVLRYHITCNNKCAHKSQEHKITCGIQTHKGSPFQAHLPNFSCYHSPPVTPAWLISLINASARQHVTQYNMIWIWYRKCQCQIVITMCTKITGQYIQRQ